MLCASLRLLERREQEDAVKLEILRRRLDAAEQDAESGRLHDYTPTLLDEIDAEEHKEFRRSGTEWDGFGLPERPAMTSSAY